METFFKLRLKALSLKWILIKETCPFVIPPNPLFRYKTFQNIHSNSMEGIHSSCVHIAQLLRVYLAVISFLITCPWCLIFCIVTFFEFSCYIYLIPVIVVPCFVWYFTCRRCLISIEHYWVTAFKILVQCAPPTSIIFFITFI